MVLVGQLVDVTEVDVISDYRLRLTLVDSPGTPSDTRIRCTGADFEVELAGLEPATP